VSKQALKKQKKVWSFLVNSKFFARLKKQFKKLRYKLCRKPKQSITAYFIEAKADLEEFSYMTDYYAEIALDQFKESAPAYLADIKTNFKKLISSAPDLIKSCAVFAVKPFKPAFAFAFDSAYERKRMGISIVVVMIFSLVGMYVFFPRFYKPQMSEANIIKTAQVKQTSAVISGQPVKWSIIVKRSDITNGQYLLKLPKTAKSIRVKTIAKAEASTLLAAAIPSPDQQLTQYQRNKLAGVFAINFDGINFRNTNTAGLAELKEFVFRIAKSINSFFLADLEEAVTDIVDRVAEQVSQDIVETDDAKLVDVSKQELKEQEKEAKQDAKSEKKEEEEEKKEEKKEEKQKGAEQEHPTSAEEEPAQNSPSENIEAGETPSEPTTPSVEQSELEVTAEPILEPAQTIEEIAQEALSVESVSAENIEPSEIVSPSEQEIFEIPEAEEQTEPLETPQNSSEPVAAEQTEIAEPEPELAETQEESLLETVSSSDQEFLENKTEEDEFVEIEYETPAPTITEQETEKGKLVTVSDSNQDPDQSQLTNVLAHTNIPEIYKTSQSHLIKIKWQNNAGQEMPFTAYDLNNNGKIDYLEWTVPHLSDQTFEIIFISKAFELDENREIADDIYDYVKEKDGIWTSLENNQYVRVTFQQILDNTNDITIYAKPTNQGDAPTIEVYTKDGTDLIATFSVIDREDTYKIFLTNLQTPTDEFDLKITGGNLDIDYIVDPVGWLAGYSYRKKITIDNANVDADLSSFPVYIKISADANIGDGAQNDGDDIRFTSSDGTTELKYEEESWAGGAGADATADYWVNVTTVDHDADTDIYIYYGDADGVDGQDPANVWDANFKGVWHLNDATTSTITDSTGVNNGTKKAANEPVEATGKIGKGQDFDGANDYIYGADNDSLDISQAITFSLWFTDSGLNEAPTFIDKRVDGGNYTGYTFYIDANGDPNVQLNDDGVNAWGCASSANLSDGAWHQIIWTNVSNSLHYYVDGVDTETEDTSAASGSWVNAVGWRIGSNGAGSSFSFVDGVIDEVRISNAARSAAWNKFEYYNISNADNELAFAAEEVSDSTPPTVSTLSPADGATTANIDANLVVTFSEAVDVETGNVTIKKTSDNSTIETIDVTSGQVTGTGTDDITINPSSDFDGSTGYYVQIDATAFDDTAGNSYAGIADTTTWNFTTNNLFDSGWTYRKKITIQNANVDADLTDFPVYVKLAADVEIGNSALATGYDIRFTSSDGTTLLKHERESWTGGAGDDATANFWVKVPTVDHDASTDIYIYYNKAGAADGQDPDAVWDANFKGVWHMGEASWSGASGEVKDATTTNNGTAAGNATTTASGKIGRGGTLDGNGDYMDVGSDSSLQGTGSHTISCWVNPTSLPASNHGDQIFIKGTDSGNGWGMSIFVYNQAGTQKWGANVVTTAPGVAQYDALGGTPATSTWVQITGVFDNSGETISLYVNGDFVTSTSTGNTLRSSGDSAFGVGSLLNNDYWPGLLDECRVSNTNRSAGWNKFEYYNIANADNELTWGAEGGANTAPTGTFNSATQNTDGTGNVAASIAVNDADTNNCKAKIQYSTSATCAEDLHTATLLTDAGTVTASVEPEPVIDTGDTYQIGTDTPILTSSANTVTFVWDSKTDLPSATGGTNYYLCLTANDGTVDQAAIGASSAIAVDNTAPTAPSSIHIVSNNATTTLAKSGDTVTVTATVDSGTTVTGTIGTKATATNTVVGTTATLTRVLDGSESEGAGLDFTLVSTDAKGNSAATKTKTDIVDGSAVQTDFTAPTVTVNQAGGQADPTNNPVISFTVVFSEAIAPATFSSGDITTGGTATSVIWSVPTTSDNITWTIATSAVGADGTVIPSISADKVTDVTGNNNTASTSTDNSVAYDGTAPTVSGVTSSLTNGSYTTSQVVPVQVNFTENVAVTGTPQLTLSTGSPSTTAVNYTSGTGTSTLTFNYTVAAGNTSADLDYALTTSLGLNSGTIKDAAGNNATLTLAAPGDANSLGANKALVIDTTAPATPSADPAGGTYNSTQSVTLSSAGSSAIYYTTNGSAPTTGSTLFSGTVSISSTTTLKALAVDAATNQSEIMTEAYTIDTAPPTVSSVAVQTGLTVNVVFSEAMGTGVTTASNYTVSGTGKGTLANNPNSAVLVSGNTYVLTWSSGEMFNGGDITITVANAQDAAGNAIGSPDSGTHTGGGIGVAPTVSGVTSSLTNGSYTTSQVVPVQVNFTENVAVTGTPQLTLSTGSPSTTAVNYTSGTGTSTLTFNYTVAAGNTSADLDYALTTSLGLNSGTIKDAAGNNATLTLATPGDANSLGANKALVIDTTAPSVGATTLSGFTTYSTYIKGTGTIVGGTATDTGGSGIDQTSCEYTLNNGGAWSAGTWSTDHCQKISFDISNGVSYTFNTRVKDIVANQGTGTATSVYAGDTSAPTTSDNSDTSWHATDQTITLTPSDGTGSGVAHTYYCIDTDNSCTPTTEGTSVSVTCAAGSTCQQYVRYYSSDNLSNSESVKTSNLVKIDAAAPVTAITVVNTDNTITATLTCADGAGSGCSTTYYCYDASDTCTPTTVYTSAVTFSISEKTYFRYYSADFVLNSASTSSSTINLAGGSGGGGGTSTPWSQEPEPAQSQPEAGNEAGEQPPQNQPASEQPASIIDQVGQQVQEIANTLVPGQQESQITYPPIAESVPKQAPPVFQGWNIMEVKPLSELALTPVESDVSFFADRIPQFGKTLTELGVDVNSLNDISKITGTELYLPGLTQTVLTGPEILAINGFAAVQGVPLADLSTEAKQKIPTDIVFAKTGGELIDYNIAISVDKKGEVEQKITTVSGKPMELVIKPDQPASSVTGFVTLTKAQVGQQNTPNVLGFVTRILTASIVSSLNTETPQDSSENALLVKKFSYIEVEPGIFEANITAPATEGEYEISTVIVPKDILLAPKETKMAVIVNPEGYVYSQTPDGRLRIQGASVSLYWQDPVTNKYELWPAEKFLQKNPLKTDETGKYSFLVPKGTYKLKVETTNYTVFDSAPFEIKEDIAVNTNIELFKKAGLLGWLNWQNFVIALLFIVIILLCVIVIFFIKRSKLEKNKI
jgi:hypothetical protein